MTSQPRTRPPLRRIGGGSEERGSVTLELAIVYPVLLAAILLVVQAGIYWHGRTLALTAAEEGLRTTSTLHGTTTSGQAIAADFLHRAGADGWLADPGVTGDRSATTATITVTARAISLIPGLPGLPIRQQASGPVERATR